MPRIVCLWPDSSTPTSARSCQIRVEATNLGFPLWESSFHIRLAKPALARGSLVCVETLRVCADPTFTRISVCLRQEGSASVREVKVFQASSAKQTPDGATASDNKLYVTLQHAEYLLVKVR